MSTATSEPFVIEVVSPPYVVDQSHPSADDNNPGTETLPWATIQHAAATLQPGERVVIKAGNYSTSFTIEGVELEEGSYPPSGTMTYTAGSHDVTVTFSGTRYAEVTVGTDVACVDLDTGELMDCP